MENISSTASEINYHILSGQPLATTPKNDLKNLFRRCSDRNTNAKIQMSNGEWGPIENKIGRVPSFDIWALAEFVQFVICVTDIYYDLVR